MTPVRAPASSALLAVAVAVASAALVAGCGKPPPSTAPPAPGEPLPTVEVRAAAPAERRYDGSVEAVRHATLTAQTAGRVAEVLRDVDDRLLANETLLRLGGVEQRAALRQAEQALRGAEARSTVAAAEYERLRDVYAKRLVSRSALDRATAERDAAAAEFEAAQAAVAAARESAGYTEVRAPYAAVVTRRHVEPGESVAPGQPLMEVASLERMRVVVDLPSTVAGNLRTVGTGAKAMVWIGERAHESRAITVFPAATAQSSTVRVRVDLAPGAQGAYPGLYAKVAFVGAEPDAASAAAGVPTVPVSAVAVRSEVTAVYVVGTDGRLQFRQVRLGRRDADGVEVLAGLAPGERIVADPIEAARRRAGVAP